MGGRGPIAYQLKEYHYDLPTSLIAQTPSVTRASSRLLVLHRSHKRLEHARFEDVVSFLKPGDVLVVNDTRVVPGRLTGTKETGGRVEILVLDLYKSPERASEEGYECLVKASKRPQPESLITLKGGVQAKILTPVCDGKTQVRFLTSEPLLEVIGRIGEVPLPPYIHRDEGAAPVDDCTAYQTIYARHPGAVAAPTAGLHFSDALLGQLKNLGVELVPITLHVGFGTFSPIRAEDIREHRMHAEYVEIGSDSADRIARAKREGRRIVAVGTTVVRTLEWVALEVGRMAPYTGLCNHYIYPGYEFRMVDALITNFHLPESTLLLLVSAFAGRSAIMDAYREAVERQYRFFSYGDAMLIL